MGEPSPGGSQTGLQDDSGKGQHDAGERGSGSGSLPNVFQMDHSPWFSQTDTSMDMVVPSSCLLLLPHPR
ncbi:unnamed protein product [Merluccius merluccius]